MSVEKIKLYNEWVSRIIEAGDELAEYECPHCAYLVHTHVPEKGDIFDSTVQCPNCEKLHFKVVNADGVVTVDADAWDGIQRKLARREVHHAEAD